MLDVRVDSEVTAAHPDYVAVILLADGLSNAGSDAASDELLAGAEAELRARGLRRAVDHPHIASWREAFSGFGAKPSKYPCSAEALISRVLKGQPLPRVNVLVDLYNSVSVRHVIPVGGEDADRLQGGLRLTYATGEEVFDPRGDGSELEPVPTGEIVWRDARGVTCRRWNWRQGRRTQLTETTTRAFFVFDRLSGVSPDQLQSAADDLSDLLLARWPDCQLTQINPVMLDQSEGRVAHVPAQAPAS